LNDIDSIAPQRVRPELGALVRRNRMDLRKLQRIVVDALDDIKAQDIRVFNTTGQTELFDRVIIATGTSNRQTRSLAAHVRDKVKEAGGTIVSMEGGDTGEWVLVDLGDAVVHIMQPAIRAYYNLEELWGAKPVRMQISRPPAASRAPAASRPPMASRASAAGEAAAAKKAPARKRKPRAAAG
jgi:ribosome-associated protein